MPDQLTAIVLAHEEEQNIRDCIASVQWADRVVVIMDPGNQDGTADIATNMGADVILNPFENFAQQRNAALDAVDAAWILFIDADERSSPAQAREIRALLAAPAHHGFWIPRRNYIFGKLTRHTGWSPDYQLRLLERGHAHYDADRPVHEVVQLDGDAGYLEEPFVHYNYTSVAQFRRKQRQYVRYDAQILKDQGIRPQPHKFITQPARHFFWRFVELRGYRDGWHGLRLSVLMAWYELQKYVQLRRLYNGSDTA